MLLEGLVVDIEAMMTQIEDGVYLLYKGHRVPASGITGSAVRVLESPSA